MNTVQLSDRVTISYTATQENGEVFEKVTADKPITLNIGSGRLLLAVEAAMMGMRPGETRTMQIQPEDAYGPHFKELIHTVKRASFAGRIDPKPGMILSLSIEKDGVEQQVPATVIDVSGDSVTVDYNHPLAGQVLTYAITLHDIVV